MKVSFIHPDPTMPRTVFWDMFTQAVRRNPRYVDDPAQADMVLPAEDTAYETNWPRYGNQQSAFIRGGWDQGAYERYLNQLVAAQRPICIVNMHPFIRLPRIVQNLHHVFVADICLERWERSLNPRTISMPALPVTMGAPHDRPRPVTLSFRGAPSHPCRTVLAQLHDGQRVICQLVQPANHAGRIDSQTQTFDTDYVQLLEQSDFALVPRGDALFSYRLLEVMSFACIPVILSDGWVLPFDRTLDWDGIGLHVPESQGNLTAAICDAFPSGRRQTMRDRLRQVWADHLGDLDRIVETMLRELEMVAGEQA